MLSIRQIEYDSPAYHAAWHIREDVLRKPLGRSLKDDDLSNEMNETIIAAFDGDVVVGCVILAALNDTDIQLKQFAIAENQQGKNIGKALGLYCEDIAHKRGFQKIILHARSNVKPFYDKLGYTDISEEHLRVGIPHVTMEKTI